MKRSWMILLAGVICIAWGGTLFAQAKVGPSFLCTAPWVPSVGCPAAPCTTIVANPKQCNGAGPWIPYNAFLKPPVWSGNCVFTPGPFCASQMCLTHFYNLGVGGACATSPIVCSERLPINNGEC